MKANQAQAGKLYRVTKCPHWEYLTVGEVYKSDGYKGKCVGLHRLTDGGGTYLRGAGLDAVELEEVMA